MKKAYLYHKVLLTALFIAVFIIPVQARLAPSKFSDLINQSELIILTEVISVDKNAATLKIIDKYKGNYDYQTITIRRSNEIHDQRIRSLGSKKLLFLKKSDGVYTGTHYGKSYWNILFDKNSNKFFAIHKGPTQLIDIDIPNILNESNVRYSNGKETEKITTVIFLDDIARLLSKHN
jgi:hypothetical protein